MVLALALLVAGLGWLPLDWPFAFSPRLAALGVALLSFVLSALLWQPVALPPGLAPAPPLPPVAGMARIEFFNCPLCGQTGMVPHGAQQRMVFLGQPLTCPRCQRRVQVSAQVKWSILLTAWLLLASFVFIIALRRSDLLAGDDPFAALMHLTVLPLLVLLGFAHQLRAGRQPLMTEQREQGGSGGVLHWATFCSVAVLVVAMLAASLAR